MVITYRIPTPDDRKKVSEQIRRSYVAVYERLMDHDYLSTLKADHWEPILQESIQNGDTCLIAECDGNIIGSTVFGKFYISHGFTKSETFEVEENGMRLLCDKMMKDFR